MPSIETGNVKISVWFNDMIGFDDEYFIPKFEKAISCSCSITEWNIMGLAFDSYIILEYDSIDEMLVNIKNDLKAIQTICNRNKKRFLKRNEKNERNMMRITCQMGTLIDDWINDRISKGEKIHGWS